MTITPPELLDTSIMQLQTLIGFLDDQLSWTESAGLGTHLERDLPIAVPTDSAASTEDQSPGAIRCSSA
jgi:hypothetical protein